MSDDKKIEISQSDAINAYLHQRGFQKHYATKESVDNLKENLKSLATQLDKQFDRVDKNFQHLEASIGQVSIRLEHNLHVLKNILILMIFSILGGAVGATAFIVARLPT